MRQAAIIESASITLDRDFFHSVWVHVKYDADGIYGGGHQGFGGIVLGTLDKPAPELMKSYVADLCAAFDAQDLERLAGMKCHVLFSFPGWNGTIEGLEGPSGKRFTITAWRRKHFPESTKSPLEQRIEDLEQTRAHAKRTLVSTALALSKVKQEFVDWEK